MSCPLQKGAQADLSKGAYLLRTNCTERDPAKLWRWSWPSSAHAIQNCRKCSGEKPLKNAANPHGCVIGFRKLRNLG
jgi:hypothetical protein